MSLLSLSKLSYIQPFYASLLQTVAYIPEL